MNAHQRLSQRIAESIQFSRRRAIVYNIMYRTTRGSIIVLSALTAAMAKSTKAAWAVPAISCAVAILAAMEAWLKPGKIYREHFRFNDLYIAAETRLALISPSDTSKLESFTDSLDSLDKQYRSAIED